MESVGYTIGAPSNWLPSEIWRLLRDEWDNGNQTWSEIPPWSKHGIVARLLNDDKEGPPLITEAIVDHFRNFMAAYNAWTFTDDEQVGIMIGKTFQDITAYVGDAIGDVYDYYGPGRLA